ncbi:MAG: hypothetical protein M3Q44_03895 [bacterium]|nr:hypothetical protein [bacterium]
MTDKKQTLIIGVGAGIVILTLVFVTLRPMRLEEPVISIDLETQGSDSKNIVTESTKLKYTNDRYGYSLEYPSTHEITECSPTSVYPVKKQRGFDPCASGAIDGFRISVEPGDSKLMEELPKWYKNEYSYSSEPELIDGRKAIRYRGKRINTNPAPLPENIDMLIIEDDAFLLNINNSALEREIFNSFRFSAPPDYQISKWKTIAYPELSFSFKYPTNMLTLDYPEQCFRRMKPDGWFGAFSAQFHLINNNYAQKPDSDCEPEGEDGSQLEINVKKGETDMESLIGHGSFKRGVTFDVKGSTAHLLKYAAMGGQGGDSIYINRNGYTYYIHLPNTSFRSDDGIDPLFTAIVSTFTFGN